MSQPAAPRHVVAMALHREHCGERSPQATHPADWDCHLIDADAALVALIAAGYSLLAPEATRQILEEIVPKMNAADEVIGAEWNPGEPVTYLSEELLRLLADRTEGKN